MEKNVDTVAEVDLAAAEMPSVEELVRAHTGRAQAYGLLSRLFRVEVDPLFLDQLRAMKFPAQTGNELMDAGYRAVASYLSATDGATLTELAVDYVRAFIGHGIDGHSAAYPFESVYTSEKRLMMQGSRDEVLAIYRSEGLDKHADWHDGEDHIALELEFMRVMALRTATALEDGDEAAAARCEEVQRTFMADHLLRWVPTMMRDVRIFARTGLYLGLADLTEGFLREDAELLGAR